MCACPKIDVGCAYSVVSVSKKTSLPKLCCAVGQETRSRLGMTECRGECGTKSTCEREHVCLLRLWVLGVREDVVHNLRVREVMSPASWVQSI
jgi:hypothetical protein